MRNAVVITAAGSSSRFNFGSPTNEKKEFCIIDGKTVLYRATRHFTEIEDVSIIAVTYSEGMLEQTKSALENLVERKKFIFVQGGVTRQESVFKALKEIRKEDKKIDFVAIHDGARPYVSQSLIERTFTKAFVTGAAAPAIEIADTLVIPDENGVIKSRVDRKIIRAVRTPQIFIFSELIKAHEEAERCNLQYTDDTQVYSDYGKDVYLVPGERDNIKITFAKDLK